VTIAYEVDGKSLTAVYSLGQVGGRLTLRKALSCFAAEFPRIGPKNIRGVHHGPEKQPYPRFWVKKAGAAALTLWPCEINFFTEEAYPAELHFLCPRCGEKLDLWDYLRVQDLNLFWEIWGDLRITCRQCGTSLGDAVKTALNGMVELDGWLTNHRRDEDAAKTAFVSFQTSLFGLLAELTAERPRSVNIIRQYFGAWFSRRLTQKEIGQQLKLTRERVRQLQAAGFKKLHNPGRWVRVQGNLVRQLRLSQDRVGSLEQTRAGLAALVEELQEKERLRQANIVPDPE